MSPRSIAGNRRSGSARRGGCPGGDDQFPALDLRHGTAPPPRYEGGDRRTAAGRIAHRLWRQCASPWADAVAAESRLLAMSEWQLTGTYLEACNCDAICPCRRIGGRAGGRSTHGVCLGALSWKVESGHADGVELADLGVVLASRYSDDEPGSPWSYYLYVDERGDQDQREALAAIFTGALGGTALRQFPWAFKPANQLGVRAAAIEIDHTPGRGWFRAGEAITVRIREPVPAQEPVTCVISGHHRSGRELFAELLEVGDAPLEFDLSGVCAYESTFDYSSAD